ncbi:hypothetical protein [Bifidobacterium choloepi]|uniref:Uncharacterized protein n=1 Tax=Bifidobacterium choloepi TaxID=2614131 RepID=A0A6I5MXB2_9BIFI|nr:hypothetical protein [Bifidobacterium choloepi]NEG69208.1 hypothetical protein [Bifidobacterium choloepi]
MNDNENTVQKESLPQPGDLVVQTTIMHDRETVYSQTLYPFTSYDQALDVYHDNLNMFPVAAGGMWQDMLDADEPHAQKHRDGILPTPEWAGIVSLATIKTVYDDGRADLNEPIQSNWFALADAVVMVLLVDDVESCRERQVAAEAELFTAQQSGDDIAIHQVQHLVDTEREQFETLGRRVGELFGKLYRGTESE